MVKFALGGPFTVGALFSIGAVQTTKEVNSVIKGHRYVSSL